MDWIQFTIFILGNMVFTLTLWLWNRAESRTDNRKIHELIEGMKTDVKDFHGRLCALEEKYFHMMERYLEDRRNQK